MDDSPETLSAGGMSWPSTGSRDASSTQSSPPDGTNVGTGSYSISFAPGANQGGNMPSSSSGDTTSMYDRQPFFSGTPGMAGVVNMTAMTNHQVRLPDRTGSPAITPVTTTTTTTAPTTTKTSTTTTTTTATGAEARRSAAKPAQTTMIPPGLRHGVTISPPFMKDVGPGPFTTAGRGAGQTRTSQPRDLAGWDMTGLCMSAAFNQNGVIIGGINAENPWDMPLTADGGGGGGGGEVDWDAFTASLGLHMSDATTGGATGGNEDGVARDGNGGGGRGAGGNGR